MNPIPFNRPWVPESAYLYIREAVANKHLSGDGPFTLRCQAILERMLKSAKVLLTTSCTHALEMAALLLDILPGDEVIFPSFTFVSTVNAFVLRGATPIFVDIRPDTLNLDELLLRRLITSRTKAIVPVHYAGVACEMDSIMATAKEHGVAIVEDNAHGLLGQYQSRPLGSFGMMGTLSFHETKNFICGEGGALIINDSDLIDRAEIIREKGTNRKRFFRGQVDKYTWLDIGSSYLPSDMLAALLYSQLELADAIQARRKALWEGYAIRLSEWAGKNHIRLPIVPRYCDHSAHLFYLLLPSLNERQALIAHLRERGIHSVFHYLPLHLSEMGQRLGGRFSDCPVTEDVSTRLLRLPLFYDMTDEELNRIVTAVTQFRVKATPTLFAA